MHLPILSVLATCCLLLGAAIPHASAAARSPEAVRAPVAGSALPAAPVSHAGATADLKELFAAGKHVLIVYRGGWCPICTKHFSAIAKSKKMLTESGWQISGLSPDSEASVAAWTEKHGKDGIRRISDSQAKAIEALGLGFKVNDETIKKLHKYGIDIEKASGSTHRILPIPTVLLIVDGEIRYVHADAYYPRRLHPKVLQAAVAAIDSQKKKK